METKQEKIKINKVYISNIISGLLSIFERQAKNRNIYLYTKQIFSEKESEIYTDCDKVTQILTNLITNALKFTHEGYIEFGYNLKENELEFYVKDTGIGINDNLCEKIFERFRQADKTIQTDYGGTGLGLSISKGFVELLGGKIWVESELGKGSVFYFTIPYKPVNQIEKTAAPIKKKETFRSVLVAEDEEINFLFLELVLKKMNLNIIYAKNGKEAVEICKANIQIDLILMDIKMPVMDGHTAAKKIKEFRPGLPIVAQSAYASLQERENYGSVFDDYLVKPIMLHTLNETILKYI
ncbi:MAG: ATP-binding protein [bacterium]